MSYTPPVKDMLFVLNDLLGFSHDDLDSETIEAVLDEAAKLSRDVLAPINHDGDEHGAKLQGDNVTTAPGFKDAYNAYRDGGWNAVPFPDEYGGQGLPWSLAFPVQEMWQGANMSFGLCPLLNQGAIEAILSHGSDEQKEKYLPKLISGEWTGTMNLTEPAAGSDLGLLRTKAADNGDGTYRISGQKIYITYGEHDLADNIIHLVLARIEGAPEDVKGISLFIVPKFLDDGARNDVRCTGLEHKLGIHASPTCTMQFGDQGGATGYLVGEAHQGLKYMFTMMNNARLSVGLQGVAIAEAAYQKAAEYAAERVQGKDFTSGERVCIGRHSDVQRMLLSMRSRIEAGRAMAYDAALALDAASAGDVQAKVKVEIMTPLVKSWCTDMACDVASIGVQIHGGMGFVEETGAAQFMRDARILPIYEGTNGIQAMDLVFRKLARDGGASISAFIAQIEGDVPALYKDDFKDGFSALRAASGYLIEKAEEGQMDIVAAAAHAYLNGFAGILGGVYMARAFEAVQGHEDEGFVREKQRGAEFYIRQYLPFALAHLSGVNDKSLNLIAVK